MKTLTWKYEKYYHNAKKWKNIKNIENIVRGVGRLVRVGEDPDSLPEPEHLNQLQTPYNVAADRLPLLLNLVQKVFSC